MEGTFLIFCLLLSLAETSFQFRINLLNKMDETKKQNGMPPPQLPTPQLSQLPPFSPAKDQDEPKTKNGTPTNSLSPTQTSTGQNTLNNDVSSSSKKTSTINPTSNNTTFVSDTSTFYFPTTTIPIPCNGSTETATTSSYITPTSITANPCTRTDSSNSISQALSCSPPITSTIYETMTTSDSSKRSTRPTFSYNTTWKIVLKINDTFNTNMGNRSSEEYHKTKEKYHEPLTNSCAEVIGDIFLGLDDSMTFDNGSIAIETPLQINGNLTQSSNYSWENSLKNTIPLYIPGSFNISYVGSSNSTTSDTKFTPPSGNTKSTPPPENFATRIAIGCGVGGTVLVIVAVTLVFVWYRRRQSGLAKRPLKEKIEMSTNISLSIPRVNAGLTWRESSGVSSMSTAPKSESFNRHSNVSQAEDNDEPSSLHRKEHYSDSVITDLMVFQLPVNPVQRQITEYSQSTSSSDGKTKRFPGERFPQEYDAHRSKVKLPRIEITPEQINKQFNNLSQKSQPQPILDRRNKIILNPQMTTNPTGYGSTPADFGGLFVPGNSSDFYQTSSYGSMPNMGIYQVSENIEDVDLKNISNEGELFSLTPRTDTNIMTRISTITKNIFTKNKNDMLHRSNLTGKK